MKIHFTIALPVVLGACSTFMPADHQAPGALTVAPLSNELRVAEASWPSADGWRKYNDDTLTALIEQALQQAPSIASAEARFSNAREAVRISAASAGLRVDGQASVARQRLSDNGLFSPQFLGFNWYNQSDLGLQASYSFDFWHKRQAATEAAVNEARAAQAERSAVSLTLAASIAESYFGWQADQAQLQLLDEQLQLLNRRQQITQARVTADLETAEGLYSLDAGLAALRSQHIAQAASAILRRVLIASLLGVSTEQLPGFTARVLPTVSAQLPDSVRIDLLARRADIVASRWRIEAAQQTVRAARAEFMPDISVNALAAFSSIDLGKLLNAGSAAPAVGVALHLPIFDSGLLKAQYGARAAQLDLAVTRYNETVVNAAREVASGVISLQQLVAQREQALAQLAATQKLVSAAQARNRQGLTDLRPVLLAQQLLQTQRAVITSLDAAALRAEISLQLALGGGFADANSSAATNIDTTTQQSVNLLPRTPTP